MVGILEYSQREQRFGIIDNMDLWATMLHCGDVLTVSDNGTDIVTRIEMSHTGAGIGDWYLLDLPYRGEQMRGLRVRIE